VLPTHAYETLGKTILESYAHGKAVIASDLGSRRELIKDGETGYLYPTGNVEKLAQAIRALASSPNVARRMGSAGYERVRQRHTPEAHYDAVIQLYERVIGEKRTGRVESRPMPLEGKVRVAFIGGRGVISKYSGIETYYEEVGKRLAAMGHEVTVYCRPHFTPPIAQHNGMRIVRVPTIRTKHLETFVHTLFSTVHAITQPYDIVHYHTLGPALFSFIPRLFGKKTLVTVQGLDWQRKKWGRFAAGVLRAGERASATFPNGTMVVSQTLQQFYRERYGVETFYVPNGGLLREVYSAGKLLDWQLRAGDYVLFLGRFSPEKGCHLLVEAFESIPTTASLVMAGASSYCDDYSKRLRAHANDRIRMMAPVADQALDELLTNAMVFVLPSEMEGLSLALLDAMGAGLCVLASDIPENREAVEGAGYTFVRGDAASLAERLGFLMENREVRKAAGRAAQRRIREHYQWSRIAGEIERAYYEVLGWSRIRREEIRPAQEAEVV
jgi:glycosyltransferase involved in cell wall biosynthesis